MSYNYEARSVTIATFTGLTIGILEFIAIPVIFPSADNWLSWGFLLWNTTLGTVIGVIALTKRYRILPMIPHWYVLGPLIGAWLNFVLTFFSYREMETFLITVLNTHGIMSSPFWFVAEGALVGLLIAGISHLFAHAKE